MMLAFAAWLTLAIAQEPRAAPDALGYEGGDPFGARAQSWRVDATGRGEYSFKDSPLDPPEEGHLDVGAAGFAQLYRLLADLEGGTALSCNGADTPQGYIFDAGGGALFWARDGQIVTQLLDFGCASEEDLDATTSLRDAELLVRRWAREARQ